jgi:hypothetical protein
MRQAVYGTARLGLHKEFSEKIRVYQGGTQTSGCNTADLVMSSMGFGRLCAGSISALGSVASSMTAGALASIVGTPFDVSLVRMQADSLKPPAGAL